MSETRKPDLAERLAVWLSEDDGEAIPTIRLLSDLRTARENGGALWVRCRELLADNYALEAFDALAGPRIAPADVSPTGRGDLQPGDVGFLGTIPAWPGGPTGQVGSVNRPATLPVATAVAIADRETLTSVTRLLKNIAASRLGGTNAAF